MPLIHDTPQTGDLKLKLDTTADNIFHDEKGDISHKSRKLFWQALYGCTEVKLQYKLTPLCTIRQCKSPGPYCMSVQTHGGLYCTEVVLLTTLSAAASTYT